MKVFALDLIVKNLKIYIVSECSQNDLIIIWDKIEYKPDYPILIP